MSFARGHRPIKVGLLFDFLFPPPGTWDVATGSSGTHISYGRLKRNGWHGAGYLTARSVADDLASTVLRGRVDGPV